MVRPLTAKGIHCGWITARSDGSVDTSQVSGVDSDLRVKPLFHHGGTISIREFVVGALQNEMGLQAVDPELMRASKSGWITTPAGVELNGAVDTIEVPPTDDPDTDPDPARRHPAEQPRQVPDRHQETQRRARVALG